MASTYEGMLEIPGEEFWTFVSKYMPNPSDECIWGVPRYNPTNETLDIFFAAGGNGHPEGWAKKPAAIIDMEKYRGDHDNLTQAICRALLVLDESGEDADIATRVKNILKEAIGE